MVLLKKMMLATSLFLVSSFASAAVLDLTKGSDNTIVGVSTIGSFLDTFNFTLAQDSVVDQNLAFLGGFDGLEFSISEAGSGVIAGTASLVSDNYIIDDLFLQAGNYVTTVGGNLLAGTFIPGLPDSGVYSLATSITAVSPVPEASTIAMMLGGLGLVGFMARRRKAA